MYQPPLTWTRFQQKTGLINTIILLRHIGPYKVLQGKLAAQQLIVHILIFHHYINLDTASIQPAKFLPVFQAWNLQDWSYESTNTNLTGLFTTFERFEFVKESFAGPFRENNFLFLLLYGATFVFVCAYVCVCEATTMPSKGWFNLEAGASVVPETQFFEGDSAFKFLGLSKTTRLYGFIAWCVF